MAPIRGRPFLACQMDYWIAQGIQEFVLSVGYRHEVIMGYFGDSYAGADIRYAIEPEPCGTGGGLLLATEQLSSVQPVLALNGDTFFAVSLAQLVAFHAVKQSDWTCCLFRTQDTQRYLGLQLAADGQVVSLNAEAGATRYANGGVYLVKPDVITDAGYAPGAQVALETEILPQLLACKKRLSGLVCSGQFIDIGLPEDYFHAQTLLP
ncbi:MAG: sugar phosphate nucleotidyltransferase, partial [Pseudomonadota bacterium]